MSVNPNATATLIFAGLALSYHNRQNDKWEFLFIRDAEDLHHLRIVFDYETPNQKEIPIDFGDKISVEVTKPKSSSGKYEPTKHFHRDPATDDPQDFRWILDFSSPELHDHAVTVTKGKRDNFFSTPNAVFYNYMMSNKVYDLQKLQDGVIVGPPEPLAAIGDYTGADIECETGGSITITVEGDGGKKTYDVTPKSKVFFNNICDSTNPKCDSDFTHYYEVISDKGETFELIRQIQKIMPRSAQFACETGTVGDKHVPPDSIGDDGNH